MPNFVGAAQVADDLQWTFVTSIEVDQFLVGQAFLRELAERFDTQLQCLLGNHGYESSLRRNALHFADFFCQFRQEFE